MCEKCRIGQELYRQALAVFDAKYPKACRQCGGTGIIIYNEDPGDRYCSLASSTMEFEETCLLCEGASRPVCAVCGKMLIESIDQERHPNGRACGCDNVQRPQAEFYFDPDCPCTMPPVESVTEESERA